MESEPKKQKRKRRTFTDEFRAGAVSLVLGSVVRSSCAQARRDDRVAALALQPSERPHVVLADQAGLRWR